MIAADTGRTLIVLCMHLIRSKEMVWLVYPLLMAETLLAAFFEPARSAVIPNIVEREHIVVANTLSSTTCTVHLMLGPPPGDRFPPPPGPDPVSLLNPLSLLLSPS